MAVDVSLLGWGIWFDHGTDGSAKFPAATPYTVEDEDGNVVLAGSTNLDGQIEGTLDTGKYTLSISGRSIDVDVVDGADVKVINEASLNVTHPDYGAKPDSGLDAAPAIQAALTAAATAHGTVILPPGSYLCNSTLTVPDGVTLDCPGFGNGHNGALYHNFNGHLLELEGGAMLRNLYLLQNGAFTGSAIHHVSTSTPAGFFQFERLVITDSVTDRGWERDIVIDGSASAIGVRSLFFDEVQCFGASTVGETVYLKKIVHAYFKGFEIVQAPQSTVVCGIKILDNYSEDIAFNGASIDGSFYSEAVQLAFHGRVRQGRTITCVSGSANNDGSGDVERATFVNSGDAWSNRRSLSLLRAARVTKTGSQSLNHATPTAIAFDAEDFDTDTLHDNATNNTRLTAQIAGIYRIYGAVVFAANSTGQRDFTFRVNGVTYAGGFEGPANSTGANPTVCPASTTFQLAAGDYVELVAEQLSGGALNVITASGDTGAPTHFGMERIG